MLKLQNLKISRGFFISLIVSLYFLAPFSIDEYTPSLPHILVALHSSIPLMQLTITFYMLGMMISQLVMGPLSDHYGRRIVVLWAIPIFIVGSLVCIFSHDSTVLIIGRVLQGIGIGGVGNMGGAMICDAFDGDDLKQVSGLVGTAYGVIPILAPVIGGLVEVYFGWRFNFGLFFILGILFLCIYILYLPETQQKKDRHPISVKNLMKSFGYVLTHRKYMLATFSMSFVWINCIVFSIMGPFLVQERLGYSASTYGFLALLVGLGFLVGSNLFTFLNKKISLSRFIGFAVADMLVMGLILVFLPLSGYFTIWGLMIPIFLLMIGVGIGFPIFYSKAFSAVPKYAGVANALIGVICIICACIVTALMTLLHAHSPIDIGMVYLVLSLIVMFGAWLSRE